jgi:hypothetical protein
MVFPGYWLGWAGLLRLLVGDKSDRDRAYKKLLLPHSLPHNKIANSVRDRTPTKETGFFTSSAGDNEVLS